MDEEQQSTSSVVPVIITAIFCLSLGVTVGRYYEWHKDKVYYDVGFSVAEIGKKMLDAGSMANGPINLTHDEELVNDENGIVYIRVGYYKNLPDTLKEPDSLHPTPDVKQKG